MSVVKTCGREGRVVGGPLSNLHISMCNTPQGNCDVESGLVLNKVFVRDTVDILRCEFWRVRSDLWLAFFVRGMGRRLECIWELGKSEAYVEL